MKKAEAIKIIQTLFPPNSEYPNTARIGIEILNKACGMSPGIVGINHWDCLDVASLIRMAGLCEERDYQDQLAINKELSIN